MPDQPTDTAQPNRTGRALPWLCLVLGLVTPVALLLEWTGLYAGGAGYQLGFFAAIAGLFAGFAWLRTGPRPPGVPKTAAIVGIASSSVQIALVCVLSVLT
jgi:hypothetical protein